MKTAATSSLRPDPAKVESVLGKLILGTYSVLNGSIPTKPFVGRKPLNLLK